jgi:methylase of polypeptide subunit release factors
MADRWFEVAGIDHFWIRRRFEVFRRLAGELVANAREIAEIGCGHGLLQLQLETAYDRAVAGFDLNEVALKQNVSRRSAVNCYDI